MLFDGFFVERQIPATQYPPRVLSEAEYQTWFEQTYPSLWPLHNILDVSDRLKRHIVLLRQLTLYLQIITKNEAAIRPEARVKLNDLDIHTDEAFLHVAQMVVLGYIGVSEVLKYHPEWGVYKEFLDSLAQIWRQNNAFAL